MVDLISQLQSEPLSGSGGTPDNYDIDNQEENSEGPNRPSVNVVTIHDDERYLSEGPSRYR